MSRPSGALPPLSPVTFPEPESVEDPRYDKETEVLHLEVQPTDRALFIHINDDDSLEVLSRNLGAYIGANDDEEELANWLRRIADNISPLS